MHKVILIVLLIIISCSTTKYTKNTKHNNKPFVKILKSNKRDSIPVSVPGEKTQEVIQEAMTYLSTPYRYGGTGRAGMDCSGLIHTSFLKANIELPRISSEQAKMGETVKRTDIQTGDLVFFATSGSSRITHVGLVTEVTQTDVLFIHSSTSRGVIISKLSEPYWDKRYVKANRIKY